MRKTVFVIFLSALLAAKAQVNADGVIQIGRNALYYEDYALSIQYFNQVIQAKPYLYEPYYYRAVAKYYLGDYHGANADCTLSIERDPFIDNTFRLRAISRVMDGLYADAAGDYRTLIHRRNDDRDLWYNLVLCETQQDHYAAADSLLDTMIVKWPNHSRCYMLKAQIALQRSDTVAATALIDRTLEIDPFDVDALSARGMLYMQSEQFIDAENYYDKAILQSPRKAGFYINRALARFKQNNLRGAMDDYDIALDIEEDNYLGHYNRGLLRMQVGENNLAIVDFNFVLQKEPHDRLALFNRATLREKTGDFRGAIEDYTTVLGDYPEFTTGYENRARCYHKIGDEKSATADERKVTIAHLDHMYGNKKKPAIKETRKHKDKDIDDYQKMVIENDDEDIAKFYSSDYRGRIQNKDVAVEPQPLFTLTLHKERTSIAYHQDYAPFVDKLNDEKLFDHDVYLATRESALSASDIQAMDQAAVSVHQKLEQEPTNTRWLFAGAFYAAGKRDYNNALSDLNQAVALDSTYVPALLLRAVVKTRLHEAQQFKEKDSPALAAAGTEVARAAYMPAIADLNAAIRCDSTSAYLYYNRACLYEKLHNLSAAVEDYDRALRLMPKMAEAYYNRGLIYIMTADYANGYADLSKAGELGLYSAYSLIKHFRKEQTKNARNVKDS